MELFLFNSRGYTHIFIQFEEISRGYFLFIISKKTTLKTFKCFSVSIQDNQDCSLRQSLSGNISSYINVNSREFCWIIKVPRKHYLTINVESFEAEVV